MNKGREDKALKKAIKDLPVFGPDESLWGKIEEGLEAPVSKPISRWYMNKWAALLLLPLVAGGVYLQWGNQDEVTYAEEVLQAWPLEIVATQDESFDLFLKEECRPGRDVCEDPEFKSLMTELAEVNNEVNTIITVIDESGNDEFLVKARGRLEKEETRLKRRIVELLKG